MYLNHINSMNVINKNFLRKFFLLSEWSQTFQGLRSYAARFAAAGFRYFVVMFALFEGVYTIFGFFETVLVSSCFQKKVTRRTGIGGFQYLTSVEHSKIRIIFLKNDRLLSFGLFTLYLCWMRYP
jgi:hypothetical protein